MAKRINTQRRIGICLILLLGGYSLAQAAGPVNARQIDVKPGHPILFTDADAVAVARGKSDALDRFIKTAKRKYVLADRLDIDVIRRQVAERTRAGEHEESYVNHVGIPFGLYALLTQDPIGIEYCRQILQSFINMGIDWHGPGDGHSTGKLFAMGLLYDWIHEHLSPEMRQHVRRHLVDSISFLDRTAKGGTLLNPKSYTGGHAHYAHMYALVALLAIRTDIELDSETRQAEYFRLFGKVVDHWTNGYNPAAAWINEGGGHHMGWAYSQAYARSWPYLAWESATNEASWFKPWQAERTYFYLYGLRQLRPAQFSMYPVIGDSVNPAWNPMRSGLEVAVAASLFANPHAAWLSDKLGTNDFARLLYQPEQWPLVSPPDDLPLARLFPNSGFVLMRDSWDFNKNTLMVFKSSSFYSFNHHHRDENSFTIFYKAPLAIDSGTYRAGRGYGSKHWYNYYTRSIAHNTILIYDPNERFRGAENKLISNDGGQRVINNFNPNLPQMTAGGTHHFDGIISYENHPDFTYTLGDATNAYSARKLSHFRRTVVFLRNHSFDHPVALIHDRVISNDPVLRKTYLLHMINRPTINGNTAQISVSALPATLAGMHHETILPRNPSIEAIGGRENGREFYVHDSGNGKPFNYSDDVPYEKVSDRNTRQSLLEAGQWRLEISPPEPALDDTFLHAISVVDAPRQSPRASVHYLEAKNVDGVIVHDADDTEKSIVLIQRNPGNLSAEIRVPESAEYGRLLIVGLDAGTPFSVAQSGSTIMIRSDPGGMFTSSDAGTIYVSRAQILATAERQTD